MPEDVPVPVVSDEDLVALLRSMAGATFIDRRDTAILRLLLDAGIRRAELSGIGVGDGDLQLRQASCTARAARTGWSRSAPHRVLGLVRVEVTRAGTRDVACPSRPDDRGHDGPHG
jgi:integrase